MLKSQYSNYDYEAGVDEAGRGSLAGPVTASAVIFPKGYKNKHLIDSKKITAKRREILREIIDNSSFSGDKINDYQKFSASNINKEILTAYDFYLNEKYKIKINEQTLERVKNYFR